MCELMAVTIYGVVLAAVQHTDGAGCPLASREADGSHARRADGSAATVSPGTG